MQHSKACKARVEHASSRPDVNDQSSSSESGDEQDDGNAWMGCVCETVHRVLSVFWIQCDSCKSWYNVSSQCIGFSQEEAEAMSGWSCFGCTCDDDDTSSSKSSKLSMPGANNSNVNPSAGTSQAVDGKNLV
jgi:hypothetical protein